MSGSSFVLELFYFRKTNVDFAQSAAPSFCFLKLSKRHPKSRSRLAFFRIHYHREFQKTLPHSRFSPPRTCVAQQLLEFILRHSLMPLAQGRLASFWDLYSLYAQSGRFSTHWLAIERGQATVAPWRRRNIAIFRLARRFRAWGAKLPVIHSESSLKSVWVLASHICRCNGVRGPLPLVH